MYSSTAREGAYCESESESDESDRSDADELSHDEHEQCEEWSVSLGGGSSGRSLAVEMLRDSAEHDAFMLRALTEAKQRVRAVERKE